MRKRKETYKVGKVKQHMLLKDGTRIPLEEYDETYPANWGLAFRTPKF